MFYKFLFTDYIYIDFTDVVSKLTDRMDAQHEKIEKHLKIFSKKIHQTAVRNSTFVLNFFLDFFLLLQIDAGLDKFRQEGEKFPDHVVSDVIALYEYYCFLYIKSFNNENLLDTYDGGNPGQFARTILKNYLLLLK